MEKNHNPSSPLGKTLTSPMIPLLAISFLTLALNYGSRNTFGLFLKPLVHEFGSSRAGISSILSVTMITYGGFAFLTGYLNDRFGSIIVLILGSSMAATAFFISSLASNPHQVMLSSGVLFGIATCFLSQITALSLLIKRPSHVTSLALGLVGSGPAIGSLVLTPVVGGIIARTGWRSAMLIIAFIFLGYLVLSLILFAGNRETKEFRIVHVEKTGYSLKREWGNLCLLFFSFLLMSIGIYGVLSQEVAHATDRGISAMIAALALGLVGGVGVFASPVLGWLSDYARDLRRLEATILCIAVIGVYLISIAESWPPLLLGSIIIGIVYASYIPTLPSITKNLVGADFFGRAWGLISMGGSIGAATGSFLGGVIYDLQGGYGLLWLVLGICFVGSSLLLLNVKTA